MLRTIHKLSLPNKFTKDDRPPTGEGVTIEQHDRVRHADTHARRPELGGWSRSKADARA